MFDSGAGTTVLNTSAAEALNLVYSGESRIGTGGGDVISKSSSGNTLQIGKLTLPEITLEVMPLDHLSTYFKTPLEGIIGYDLFRRFVLMIDVDNRLMSFYNSIKAVDTTSWKQVKLHRIDNNKIAVEISMPDSQGSYNRHMVIVDTGNPDEIHLFPNAVEAGNIALKIRKKKVRGFSVDSTITENLRGSIREVQFAGQKWRNVKTVIPTDSITRLAFSDNESYGLIGQELLLDFNMICDYRKNHFYFQKRQ